VKYTQILLEISSTSYARIHSCSAHFEAWPGVSKCGLSLKRTSVKSPAHAYGTKYVVRMLSKDENLATLYEQSHAAMAFCKLQLNRRNQHGLKGSNN
jgi:hypothetical protein